MPTETTSAAIEPPQNEYDRAVVALPSNATLYGDTRFVAITWDDEGDGHMPRPAILGAQHSGLPYLARYELIDRLCGDRAMRTVDGALQVRRKPLTPEAYLGLWRAAIKAPLNAEELASQHGLKILVTLGAALEPARRVRPVWTTSPFKSFRGFEAAYGPRFVLGPTASGASGFELTLDLREPRAARDAFYAQDFVTHRDDGEGHVRTSLVSTDRIQRPLPSDQRQDALFSESAS
jgi:hypothetical protein